MHEVSTFCNDSLWYLYNNYFKSSNTSHNKFQRLDLTIVDVVLICIVYINGKLLIGKLTVDIGKYLAKYSIFEHLVYLSHER